MASKMRSAATVLAAAMLAGCWQHKGALYGDVRPVTPFRAGAVVSHDLRNPSERGQALLRLDKGGVYRLVNNDRHDSDFGESFTLRFFPLAGAPAHVFVYEAEDPCKPSDKSCTPATALRYYGLVRQTAGGAEMINPDCSKKDPVAKLPGVTGDDYSCDFSGRPALETALRRLAATAWKPTEIYTFTGSPK